MIDTIIFDLDGVILESSDIKTRAFARLFAGYPDHVAEIVNYHIDNMGISRYVKFRYIFENIICQPLETRQEEELGSCFTELVLEEVLSAPYVDGVLDFIKLNYNKYKLYIASGTPEEELKQIVKVRAINQYFLGIYGTPKSKVDIISDIMNANGLKPADIVFVGDARSDRLAAEKTGVNFVARFHSGGNELDGCEHTINDFRSFQQVINNISAIKVGGLK